ncbi:Protein of unknown function [Gryllus bimaculatus]|nr:Protein of unknown function [Gryllus bimaculatus]
MDFTPFVIRCNKYSQLAEMVLQFCSNNSDANISRVYFLGNEIVCFLVQFFCLNLSCLTVRMFHSSL